MTITMEERKFFGDKYIYGLKNLLLSFLEDTYLPTEERDDKKTIEGYVKTFGSKTLELTIKHCHDVLAQQPFPYEWISDTCNRFPFNKPENDSPEGYYNWMTWVLKTLEEEAQKSGKLSADDIKRLCV